MARIASSTTCSSRVPESESAPARRYRLLLTTWQDFGAGSIQSVQYLAQGLHARGHDVRVACPAQGVLGRRLLAAGVPVVDFRFRRGWSVADARRIDRIAREHDIQLIDAQESRDRKAAILARMLLRTPAQLVITRRQQTSTFPPLNALYAWSADRVIAISEGVKRSLIRKGMPGRRISVVHTGLDPERVSGAVSDDELRVLRAELGIDARLPTLGVVARRKDQETLLRAVARLGRPVNVLFAGIERDERLRDLERDLPRGARVAYAGFRERVLPLYRLLDVQVLTTRAEGLSQANLEAMALGLPVVSAAVGGTPEVIRHAENGLLFPPGDDKALCRLLAVLLDDAALRARLVAGGRATVAQRFHADSLVLGTEAVYRELIEGPD